LRYIFLCFEAALGLRINLGKSENVPIGEVDDVEGLAQLLGCRVASLPMTDANQTTQELREKDMGYFEGAMTSKTPKDVLGFDNTQA
jgi:hypothetical protein